MATKGKNPYADTEFVRAYHTEVRELQSSYNVRVVSHITTAYRPDRVVIALTAFEMGETGWKEQKLCSTTMEWPNVQSMSFSAALFRCAVSLTRLVQDSVCDVLKTWATEGQEG